MPRKLVNEPVAITAESEVVRWRTDFRCAIAPASSSVADAPVVSAAVSESAAKSRILPGFRALER
jgi:hypothetical protein